MILTDLYLNFKDMLSDLVFSDEEVGFKDDYYFTDIAEGYLNWI